MPSVLSFPPFIFPSTHPHPACHPTLPSLPPPQGHENELLDQLTGGRVVPTAGGEEGGTASAGAPAGAAAASQGGEEAFRPSTFSFLRSVTLQREEEEQRASEGAEGAEPMDPAAAEATRRAFEGAVLAQWQRLRAMRVG